MNESLVKFKLLSIVNRITGVLCIIITDRDGTPIIRVTSDDAPPELALATKPPFLATFTMATDQASKLGLGKNQSIVCMYSNYQVIFILYSSICGDSASIFL